MFTYKIHISIMRRVMLVSWHISGGTEQYAKIYSLETLSPGTDLNRGRTN
jgi:hypothetical protein